MWFWAVFEPDTNTDSVDVRIQSAVFPEKISQLKWPYSPCPIESIKSLLSYTSVCWS